MSNVTYAFDGWAPVIRTIVVGVAIYVTLVVSLRISGSRTLAKMNAFDFIVTIAIGSVFGSALLTTAVSIVQAAAALVLLLTMQLLVGLGQERWSWFEWAVTNPPTMLYYRGEYHEKQMRRHRMTEADLRAAVRMEQSGSFEDVDAIVLETGGDVSVITTLGDESAMGDLPPDEPDEGFDPAG
ncbi:DUF421 domain-containing protein [Salinarchaeum chitinilyticum]